MSVPLAPATECSWAELLDVLDAEASAVFGNRERIEQACAALREAHLHTDDPQLITRLARLGQTVTSRVAAHTAPIVSLLREYASVLTDPWPVIEPLLDSHDANIVGIALGALERRSRESPAFLDARILGGIAARADRESGPLTERPILEYLASLFRDGRDLVALCTSAPGLPLRRLAARLLDLDGTPAEQAIVEQMLGAERASFLAPHLAWTRATHLDLVSLVAGDPASVVESFEVAQETCGEKLLREVIAAIGWPRLNLGIDVRPFTGFSVGGSYPLLLAPPEASLLEEVDDKKKVFDRFLFVAHGGEARTSAAQQDPSIAQFRDYNLAHAELLSGFLDVAPLSVERVRATVAAMDRIVANFQQLFAAYTDECPTLAAMYPAMRASIEKALEAETGQAAKPLSPELTRLVDMFEDPQSLAEVHTLHGLKRYLHQKGLKLGMRLAEAGRTANRTVTFALATGEKVLQTSAAIEYVDFEGAPAPSRPLRGLPARGRAVRGSIPPPVALLADEFGRQLVHAEQALPRVKVFCYGTEVHYFVQYRNHPLFVRIDYSPPARGGMIDLAYFGVSKYELASHPATSLPAIERFFRRLDFDVSIDNTHVQARYDKERAFDLADLCDKAAALFRLAPYLMDVDWVIGDLALSATARLDVAAAWAEFFATWGVLPYARFLTTDRTGILAALEAQLTGPREQRWNGEGSYRDVFSSNRRDGFWDRLRESAEKLGLRRVLHLDGDAPISQLAFETRVARPLREAIERGEVIATPGGPRRQSADYFERRHPAECLAGILCADAQTIASAAHIADIVTILARGLRFHTTGAINSYDVQRASLPLLSGPLALYGLRDGSGIFRLAFYAAGDSLHARRANAGDAWQENWSVDVEPFVAQLRRANYQAAGPGVREESTGKTNVHRRVRRFRSSSRDGETFALSGFWFLVSGLPSGARRPFGRKARNQKPETRTARRLALRRIHGSGVRSSRASLKSVSVVTQDQAARATALLALFASENPRASLPPLPGERLLSGVAASPGRAVGPARLGLANRHPDDVEGAIIVSPSITPGDGAFLVKSAGVVSTGGGALSHAGLLALQYGKPALVVSGAWHRANGTNLSTFAYRTVHYDERVRTIGGYRVTERHHLREREELLHEGDLVVLDADGSLLRILGQERDALSLHDSLQQLELANRQLAAIAADTELLVARGRRLRARHQLEKILVRLTDPILACHAVGEMVLRDSIASPVPLSEQAQLLALLLRNPAVGETVRTTIAQVIGLLSRRRGAAMAEARRVVAAPSGVDVPAWRLLTLRLDVLHLESLLTATHSVAVASGAGVEIAAPDLGATGPGLLDEPIRQELLKIRATLVEKTRTSDVPRLRHLIDELDRIDSVLGTDTRERALVARLHHNVVVHDREVERTVAGRRIVTAAAGGIELRDVAGNKAANLAQVALLGEGAFVPPWFVVTDVAFRQALRAPLVDKGASAGQTARQAIESIVARPDLTNAQKAAFIRHVWECVDLPDDLVTDVRQAYRAWCEPDHAAPDSRPFSPAPAGEKVAEGRMRGNAAAADPFVAVRSSASEEDLEAAARAGEFDTFLFVRGEEALIAHLRRAWSGLWSERALHSRSLLGTTAGIGGGVLVQKMIDSRASGVLHTVNIAERRLREMVINAGLGLGEGIVSGTVASDRIIVSKEGDLQHGELHFRYLTADKRERVVFNSRVGSGTARVETLYHQRLRPALEYVEICELVRAAARLEEAYGYPLDIEFAVEGTSLYLLQVRPIPTPLTVWRETVERWPLGVRTSSSAGAARPRAALEGNTEARGRAAEAGQNARTPKESS